jgi:hypothetical protein
MKRMKTDSSRAQIKKGLDCRYFNVNKKALHIVVEVFTFQK